MYSVAGIQQGRFYVDDAQNAALVGYARVSTEGQNLSLQRTALREAGCQCIFEDVGSGIASRRPGLEAAFQVLAGGGTLVVWRVDRLGRSYRDLIRLADRLRCKAIGIRSLADDFDTTSSSGRLFLHVMGAVAQFERELISERTRAGMRAARNSGRRIGRPPLLTAEQRREVMHALQAGVPARHVAERFCVSLRTIERIRQAEQNVRGEPFGRLASRQ